MMVLTHLIRYLVLPPGILLIAGVVGLILVRRRHRAGLPLLAAVLAAFYLLSIPLVSVPLARSLEYGEPLTVEQARASGAEAIVVLGGGMLEKAPEYGGANASASSLLRVRYGAWLHHRTGLPVLVTTGNAVGEDTEASTMRTAALELGVDPIWIEDRSRTTWENALYSKPVLESHGVERILLVTRADHMRRAAQTFRRAGLEVVPAPTGFIFPGPWDGGVFLVFPKASSFEQSCYALEEWLANLYYRLRS